MSYAKITYVVEDAIARIALNDPATLNAVTPEMIEELADAFARAEQEARCVVLTGEGRGFSSGANLRSAAPVDEAGMIDLGLRLERHYNGFLTMMRAHPLPLVTAVNGAAAGIGCSLALMGDLIVAADGAYFLQAFRGIGLVPDGGATYCLPRVLGRARAMEMMLLGERLPAAKALEWGLINRLVAADELIPQALALAGALARGPTKALGMMRALTWASLDASWSEQLTAERLAQRDAGRTGDFAEGVRAFAEKRPPQFKGS